MDLTVSSSPTTQQTPAPGPRRATTRGDRKGWVASVIGLVALAPAAFMLLAATGVIEGDSDDGDAPGWILAGAGIFFAFIGLLLVSAGITGTLNARRVDRIRRARPDAPWLADYPWDERRAVDRPYMQPVYALLAALVLGAFLLPFNWAAMVVARSVILSVIVIVLDIAVVAMLVHCVYLLIRSLKFGGSRLLYRRCPYRLGESFEADWIAPRGLSRCNELKFTLRCIRQDLIESTSDTDGGTMARVTRTQIWADTFTVPGSGHVHSGDQLPLIFTLPTDAPGTDFHRNDPRYWELAVHADTPGVNFDAIYLVPVYRAA